MVRRKRMQRPDFTKKELKILRRLNFLESQRRSREGIDTGETQVIELKIKEALKS